MKKEAILSIIVIIIFISCAICYFKYMKNVEISLYKHLELEYPTCQVKDEVNNIVLNTYYPEQWRGGGFFQYITFENGLKMHFIINTNLTSEEVYFGKVVKKGVWLMKNAGSDTLKVVTDNQTYLFIIKEDF